MQCNARLFARVELWLRRFGSLRLDNGDAGCRVERADQPADHAAIERVARHDQRAAHVLLDSEWLSQQPERLGRRRCRDCGAVGYKPRVVTIGVEGGPYGSTRITPYVCAVQHAGLRCGCPALKKTRGTWKCGAHLGTNSVSHTSAARALVTTAGSNDPPRTPLRASGDHPFDRSSVNS